MIRISLTDPISPSCIQNQELLTADIEIQKEEEARGLIEATKNKDSLQVLKEISRIISRSGGQALLASWLVDDCKSLLRISTENGTEGITETLLLFREDTNSTRKCSSLSKQRFSKSFVEYPSPPSMSLQKRASTSPTHPTISEDSTL